MPAWGDLLRELLTGRPAPAEIDIDLGGFDDDDLPPPKVVSREGIWRESSFDLQRGLDVSEEPLESMPAELIDVFRKR